MILSGGAINSPQLLLLSGDFNRDCQYGDDNIVECSAMATTFTYHSDNAILQRKWK